MEGGGRRVRAGGRREDGLEGGGMREEGKGWRDDGKTEICILGKGERCMSD